MTSPLGHADRCYGWIPDRPDMRDHVFAPDPETLTSFPPVVDLHGPLMPPVYDQGQLGSCTANALAAALEFDAAKQHLKVFAPSRLFIYYNERVMEGTVSSDAGAAIRDGVISVNQSGVCDSSVWPYNIAKFAVKPPVVAYQDAKLFHSVLYQRLQQTLSHLLSALAAGYPFVFGFTVYESFESDAVAQTGIVPMPLPHEQIMGGHAVLAVGYNYQTQRFIVRNSWGSGWGMAGYFTIPFAYVLSASLAQDLWVIETVT